MRTVKQVEIVARGPGEDHLDVVVAGTVFGAVERHRRRRRAPGHAMVRDLAVGRPARLWVDEHVWVGYHLGNGRRCNITGDRPSAQQAVDAVVRLAGALGRLQP